MSKTHSLDLLNNSISYFREAVDYAQRETTDTHHWKFAITHAVQAMELAFKEFLRRKHSALIWESVDKPGKSVSLRQALQRLENPEIGNITISDADRKRIIKAVELRGQLTHFGFEYEHQYIELKFAEIFSFMSFFYKVHLGLNPDDFIDDAQLQKIVRLVQARDELLRQAKTYIEDSGSTVWVCPNCTENTFVVEESRCCVCHYEDDVLECESCGETILSSQIVDVTEYFDYDICEGRARLINDFGAPHVACTECIDSVRDGIEESRTRGQWEDMEEESYHFGS